jgi:hypothetical protein
VFERALKLLTHNRETLERAAGLLLERETLTEAELREFARGSLPNPLGSRHEKKPGVRALALTPRLRLSASRRPARASRSRRRAGRRPRAAPA